MSLVLYLTLLETSFGMACVQMFIPRRALGPGFSKTISATCFFCLLPLGLFMGRLLPFVALGDLVALRGACWATMGLWFAYFVAINYPRERVQCAILTGVCVAQALQLGLTSTALAGHFYSPGASEGFGPSIAALHVTIALGIFASSLLLGTVTMAMLIGHWYLVIPGLAIKWLEGACLAFGAAIALKAASSFLSLAVGAWSDPFGPSGFSDHYLLPYAFYFLARYIAGLAVPSALAVMSYRAAAIRSTQSSTGILFPAMIIVFLGEMIGTFLVQGLSGLSV